MFSIFLSSLFDGCFPPEVQLWNWRIKGYRASLAFLVSRFLAFAPEVPWAVWFRFVVVYPWLRYLCSIIVRNTVAEVVEGRKLAFVILYIPTIGRSGNFHPEVIVTCQQKVQINGMKQQ
jgi:hypothetical protein